MARKLARRIGSGLSADTIDEVELNPDDSADAEQIKQFFDEIPKRLNQPWGWKAALIKGVRTRLKQIEADLANVERCTPAWASHFKKRDDEAWYVREICAEAGLAERAVAAGRPWEAVSRAIQIGELLAELRLKHKWDAYAEFGLKQITSLLTAAQQKRTSSREARIEEVDRLVAAGSSKRRAFVEAGKKFGVTSHTIKKDYYHRNSSTTFE